MLFKPEIVYLCRSKKILGFYYIVFKQIDTYENYNTTHLWPI